MKWKETNMTEEQRLNNKGFSLIEMVIAIAISVVIIAAAYSFVIAGTKNFEMTSKSTNLQQEVTFTTNLIGEAVRQADSSTALIWKDDASANQFVYLGDLKKVFCYSAADKAVYVYDAAGTVYSTSGGVVSINMAAINSYMALPDKEQHLVSKYVTSFDASCISNEDGVVLPTVGAYHNGVRLVDPDSGNDFHMIKFQMKFQYRNKSDAVDVIYGIRN